MNTKITLEQIKEIGKGEIISYKGEEALEKVKESGYNLQNVKEQTHEICLEAVRQNGDALRYVDISIFEDEVEELTLKQICEELGREVKIIK